MSVFCRNRYARHLIRRRSEEKNEGIQQEFCVVQEDLKARYTLAKIFNVMLVSLFNLFASNMILMIINGN
jgi:hypothetical protein